jgi:hypothetical protein
MTYVDWRITGPSITSCNCDWGCPCQFNARPTYGDCRAAVGMKIESGRFGTTKLDGLMWLGLFAWPKAIHEGNGEVLAVVDQRADAAQREAILKILTGQETEPGATIFNVFATTYTKVHDPLFRTIEFEADFAQRKGRMHVRDLVDVKVDPIRNPVTGAEHRALVTIPEGFEYHQAEYASSTVKSGKPIPHDWSSRHAHITRLDMTPRGPVH